MRIIQQGLKQERIVSFVGMNRDMRVRHVVVIQNFHKSGLLVWIETHVTINAENEIPLIPAGTE